MKEALKDKGMKIPSTRQAVDHVIRDLFGKEEHLDLHHFHFAMRKFLSAGETLENYVIEDLFHELET